MSKCNLHFLTTPPSFSRFPSKNVSYTFWEKYKNVTLSCWPPQPYFSVTYIFWPPPSLIGGDRIANVFIHPLMTSILMILFGCVLSVWANVGFGANMFYFSETIVWTHMWEENPLVQAPETRTCGWHLMEATLSSEQKLEMPANEVISISQENGRSLRSMVLKQEM